MSDLPDESWSSSAQQKAYLEWMGAAGGSTPQDAGGGSTPNDSLSQREEDGGEKDAGGGPVAPAEEEEEEEWGGTQLEPHVMGGTQPDEDEDDEEGGTMASGTDCRFATRRSKRPQALGGGRGGGRARAAATARTASTAPAERAETLAALNKPAVQFGTNKRALEEGGGGADAFLNPRKVSRFGLEGGVR